MWTKLIWFLLTVASATQSERFLRTPAEGENRNDALSESSSDDRRLGNTNSTNSNFTGVIARFELINTMTSTVLVADLQDGADVLVNNTNGQASFSINAIVKGRGTESVVFNFRNNPRFNVEAKAPYALCQNSGPTFFPCRDMIANGQAHVVIATPYSGKKGQGKAGPIFMVRFTLNDPYTKAPVTTAPTGPPKPALTEAPKNTPAPRSSPNSCRPGFAPNQVGECVDIDECDWTRGTPVANCPWPERCTNTVGSYKCDCLPGFARDRFGGCADVDECAAGAALTTKPPCNANADCVNRYYGYECQCQAGTAYQLAKECQAKFGCDNSTCQACQLDPNLQIKANCVNVTEACATNPTTCFKKCVNTYGSFYCFP
jgi:Calcium-binding EGF domain